MFPIRIHTDLLPSLKLLFIVSEPDDGGDRKKKTLKAKIKGSKSTAHNDNKPNISYPTNFEHTVHVGFDAVTGEFTVSNIIVFYDNSML